MVLSLSNATNDEIYISELISELVFNGVKHIPVEIYTDRKSLYDDLKSKIKEKRLRILQYCENFKSLKLLANYIAFIPDLS